MTPSLLVCAQLIYKRVHLHNLYKNISRHFTLELPLHVVVCRDGRAMQSRCDPVSLGAPLEVPNGRVHRLGTRRAVWTRIHKRDPLSTGDLTCCLLPCTSNLSL